MLNVMVSWSTKVNERKELEKNRKEEKRKENEKK
jgi:hypothetical protein